MKGKSWFFTHLSKSIYFCCFTFRSYQNHQKHAWSCHDFRRSEWKYFQLIYVSLRLRVQNAVSAQPCVGKLGISLVLLNFLDCNFRLWLETPLAFNSYPCHASEMIRNILNHCSKFPLHCVSCHICYGKISEKSFSTVIKDKLLVSKASNSYFKGLDFFQMLLASHR